MTVIKTTTMNQLVDFYAVAEKRAVPCVGGTGQTQAVTFLEADRFEIARMMWTLHRTPCQLAGILAQGNNTLYQRHLYRLSRFVKQWEGKESFRLAYAPTGENVGVVKYKSTQDESFDGRIKSRNDVQPAFNRAAVQLIRIGITDPKQAVSFLENAYQFARSEQKVDSKVDRIVNELQIGDLTREQVLSVLDRAKTKF
jgi:hypothetical protein